MAFPSPRPTRGATLIGSVLGAVLPWAIVLCIAPVGAQQDGEPAPRITKHVGVFDLEPVLVHPLVRAELPNTSRKITPEDFGFHQSVPWRIRLLPGKRKDEFVLDSEPRLGTTKFIVPGLLNPELDYGPRQRRLLRFEVLRNSVKDLTVRAHSGSEGKIRRYEVLFLDLDNDGALGGIGDGYVVKQPRQRQWLNDRRELELHKMTEGYEFDDEGLHWFEVDPGGFEMFVTTNPPDLARPRQESYREALLQLNEMRRHLGHAPVELDPELTHACELHARYCALNGATHEQDRRMPGYTKAGDQAAALSELTRADTMSAALDVWRDTFFHRIRMLSPGLSRVGMGLVERQAVLDTNSALDRRAKFEPYAWPFDGATDIPVTWPRGEAPSPFRADLLEFEQARKYGYPITLTFPSARVAEVSATLQTGETQLDCFVSSPEEPSHGKFADNLNTVFVCAHQPLAPGTTYTVSVRCTFEGQPFERSWRFSTTR